MLCLPPLAGRFATKCHPLGPSESKCTFKAIAMRPCSSPLPRTFAALNWAAQAICLVLKFPCTLVMWKYFKMHPQTRPTTQTSWKHGDKDAKRTQCDTPSAPDLLQRSRHYVLVHWLHLRACLNTLDDALAMFL